MSSTFRDLSVILGKIISPIFGGLRHISVPSESVPTNHFSTSRVSPTSLTSSSTLSFLPLLFSITARMSDHAVFLVHGLWGNKNHFWFIEEQLKKRYPLLNIHACAVNEGNKTYDGIDVGGDRVVAEVPRPHTVIILD
jgi:Putative serine esterase (DUF676)